MSYLYDPDDGTFQGCTTILEQDREYIVKYPVDDRPPFHVIFRVKPNPIGFIWRKR